MPEIEPFEFPPGTTHRIGLVTRGIGPSEGSIWALCDCSWSGTEVSPASGDAGEAAMAMALTEGNEHLMERWSAKWDEWAEDSN